MTIFEMLSVGISILALLVSLFVLFYQIYWNNKQEYELSRGILDIEEYQVNKLLVFKVSNKGKTPITINSVKWDDPLLMSKLLPSLAGKFSEHDELFSVLENSDIFPNETAVYYEVPTNNYDFQKEYNVVIEYTDYKNKISRISRKISPKLKSIQSGATTTSEMSKDAKYLSENIIKAARLISK